MVIAPSTNSSWFGGSTLATSVVHPEVQQLGWQATKNEHLKVLLDDEQATLLITEAAEHLSTADLPKEIADAIGLGTLTALLKEERQHQGHRNGGHIPSRSRTHHGTTVCQDFRGGVYALSVRALNASGD